tara:strand:- start:6535 stop:7887 length:1353 start_codon:yes stop_codon:yes gene_type:complete
MINIHVGNVTSTLKTENKKLLSILGKKYTKKLPGYQYSAAYKRSGWDGGKQYFSPKTGKFGSGLLSHIISDLEYAGLSYTIKEERTLFPFAPSDIKDLELREYQSLIVDEVLKKRSCLVKAPTGSGKTIIMASLLKALEGRTGLVFFTKKQLLYQTYKFLTKQGLDVGVAFGDGVEIKPITLCTVQSIHKVLDSHLDTSEFIMFDEVHEFSKGKLATKVLKSFPLASCRIGFTATIPSEEYAKLNLISYLGEVVEETDINTLIDEGFLTKPEIKIFDIPDRGDVEDTEIPYREVYTKYITENEERNGIIVDLSKKILQKPSKTLILVKDLKHAELLSNLIPNSYKLEGKDSLLHREETLDQFKKEEASVMIGTTIFQTGVDIPELTHLINARGLKSEIATIQALGRALRIHESKQKVFIYDFKDKVPYLQKHANLRIKSYKKLGLEVTIV